MSGFIGYPTGRLLGVVDDPPVARAALAELEAAGVAPADVLVLCGEEDARRLDGTGAVHGLRARLLRIVQFALMDLIPLRCPGASRPDGATVARSTSDGQSGIDRKVPARDRPWPEPATDRSC